MIDVFVNEEYGYKAYTWNSAFDKAELIKWWTELDTVGKMYFDLPKALSDIGGSVNEIDIDFAPECLLETHPIELHIYDDKGSYLLVDGLEYSHAGYDPTLDEPKPCDVTVIYSGQTRTVIPAEKDPCSKCSYYDGCKKDKKQNGNP